MRLSGLCRICQPHCRLLRILYRHNNANSLAVGSRGTVAGNAMASCSFSGGFRNAKLFIELWAPPPETAA